MAKTDAPEPVRDHFFNGDPDRPGLYSAEEAAALRPPSPPDAAAEPEAPQDAGPSDSPEG